MDQPDGVEVHFVCLEEQLPVVGDDVPIYFVGDLSERFKRFKRFKRKWTRLHR
jgi:calcineurin-like phosphoesterase family protein